MSKFVDIENEEFWDILSDVACVEGKQAERMENELKKICVDDTEIRAKAIDEIIEASAKAICVGCGYLDGHNCTYKGSNCRVSKPMLESVTKALEELKGGAE